jgi:hypothetical protein
VRVLEHRLPPGVEDGEETELCAEMFGIGTDCAQGLGGGVEQDVVDRSFVVMDAEALRMAA